MVAVMIDGVPMDVDTMFLSRVIPRLRSELQRAILDGSMREDVEGPRFVRLEIRLDHEPGQITGCVVLCAAELPATSPENDETESTGHRRTGGLTD